MAEIIEEWKRCKDGTLGAVLFRTLYKWLDKVLFAEIKSQTKRFVTWAQEMQKRGYFGQFSDVAPTKTLCAGYLEASDKELKRSKDFANAQKWPHKAAATQQTHKIEKFHSDTVIFVMELLKTLSSEDCLKKGSSDTTLVESQRKPSQPSVLCPSLVDPSPNANPDALTVQMLQNGVTALPPATGDTSARMNVTALKTDAVQVRPLENKQYFSDTNTPSNSVVTSETPKVNTVQLPLGQDGVDHTETVKQSTAMPTGNLKTMSSQQGSSGSHMSSQNQRRSIHEVLRSESCFFCGRLGHWRAECPLVFPSKQRRFRRPPPPFCRPSYYDV